MFTTCSTNNFFYSSHVYRQGLMRSQLRTRSKCRKCHRHNAMCRMPWSLRPEWVDSSRVHSSRINDAKTGNVISIGVTWFGARSSRGHRFIIKSVREKFQVYIVAVREFQTHINGLFLYVTVGTNWQRKYCRRSSKTLRVKMFTYCFQFIGCYMSILFRNFRLDVIHSTTQCFMPCEYNSQCNRPGLTAEVIHLHFL